MNKKRLITSLVVPLILSPSILFAADKVAIDPTESELRWTGKKVTGSHTGTLAIKEGYVHIKDNLPVDGQIVFDMTSIDNTDLEDPEYKKKLENHLKSDDFFSVDSFNTASFQIESVSAIPDKEDLYTVAGTLTIKGITKPLTFQSRIEETENAYTANANLTFDRTLWNVKYNSGKFFSLKNLGDKLIYDEIEVTFSLTAPKNEK